MIKIISSFNDNSIKSGVLYLVPTPIGNINDITYRAVNILSKVNLIASEDTRHTQKLLNHFNIKTKQISFHKYNIKKRIPNLLNKLEMGYDIAEVSDAGMPLISDPGLELVEECIKCNIRVVSVPGANAALTGLIASGIVPHPFMFYGFLPKKKREQINLLLKLNLKQITMIFYESPHRVNDTIKNMSDIFGSDRKVVICRELTKYYEEYIRGTITECLEWLNNHKIKGELVIIVQGNNNLDKNKISDNSNIPISLQVKNLISKYDIKPNEAIKQVAKENNLNRQIVYRSFHKF